MAIGRMPPDFLSSANIGLPKNTCVTEDGQWPASTMLTNAVMSVRKWGLTPGRKLTSLGAEVGGRRGHLLTLVEKTVLFLDV